MCAISLLNKAVDGELTHMPSTHRETLNASATPLVLGLACRVTIAVSAERDTHPHLLQCTAKWLEGEDLTARIWLTQPTLNAFSGLPYVHFLTQQRDLIHHPDLTVNKLSFMFFFVQPSCATFDRDTKRF